MLNSSKYLFRFVVGLLAYGLGLVVLNLFYQPQWEYKYWLVLLPGLPLLYVLSISIRALSELDEMWRKILTEGMAFSGLATGFTCFTYLFVRDMGAPEFHGEWAFYLMWGYYGIGSFLSSRRYQ